MNIVQDTYKYHTTAVSSDTITLSNPVGTAHSLVAVVAVIGGAGLFSHGGGNGIVTGVSDNINGSYTGDVDPSFGPTPPAIVIYIFRFSNTKPGSTTVTVTLSSAAYLNWAVFEVDTILGVDSTATAEGTSYNPAPGSITTTHPTVVLGGASPMPANWGGYIEPNGLTAPPGFTAIEGTHQFVYQINSAIVTESPQWSNVIPTAWGASIAAYYDLGNATNGGFPLFINGRNSPINAITLFVDGGAKPSGTIPLFLKGSSPVHSGIPLFLYNHQCYSNMPLFLQGNLTNSSNDSGNFSLFTYSAPHSDALPSGNIPPGTWPVGTMPLWISGGSRGKQWTYMNLFEGGCAHQWSNQIPLSICNHQSGVINSIPLFIEGLGVTDSAMPTGTSMNLFIRRGAGNAFSLYTQGPGSQFTQETTLWVDGNGVQSGVVPLSIPKVVGTQNNHVALYIHGF